MEARPGGGYSRDGVTRGVDMKSWACGIVVWLGLAGAASAQVAGSELVVDGATPETLAEAMSQLPLTVEDIDLFIAETERLVAWLPDHPEAAPVFLGGASRGLPVDAIAAWELWGEEEEARLARARDWLAAFLKVQIASGPSPVDALKENSDLVAAHGERIGAAMEAFQGAIMGLRNPPPSAEARAAAEQLEAIVRGQKAYFERARPARYAADLATLAASRWIPEELHDGEEGGYTFTVRGSASGWTAHATPGEGLAPAFHLFVDQSGVVRIENGAPAGSAHPPLSEVDAIEAPVRPARAAVNEASAISSLRTLVSSQAMYFQGDIDGDGVNDYGLLSELYEHGLIGDVLGKGTKSGYNFSVVITATGWEAVALPVSGEGRRFYVNETGVIRFSLDGSPSAESPPIE